MTWFKGQDMADLAHLREAFRRLCMKLHPDKGGVEVHFKDMLNEYQSILKTISSATYEESRTTFETEGALADMISRLMVLNGISIEVCGSWLWVAGETYLNKDALKTLGFRFSGKKKRWYWCVDLGKAKRRGRYNMKQIYQRFGVSILETEKTAALAG